MSALSEPSAALFVVISEFLPVFLVIGFASRDKVLEEHAVIDDLYVKDEESAETSDTDAVDVVIADKLYGKYYFNSNLLLPESCFRPLRIQEENGLL